MGSRLGYSIKNSIWSLISTVINLIISFVLRTVFIYYLGVVYLGINSLFSSILGVLSLAELGIEGAICFNLYKPLADSDEKLAAKYIYFYKKAYRVVALVLSLLGVAIIPFLNFFVKEHESIKHLNLVFLIFLFNTVTSYLITYKAIIFTADQKNFKLVRINTVIRIIISLSQILVLLITKNYILYLITDMIIQLAGKIYINYYTNAKYPFLKGKPEEELSRQERSVVFSKIKGLFFHKFGDVAVNQTDSIITSVIINVSTVGLVSNYVLIINTIFSILMAVLNSATASLGNISAVEDNGGKYIAFKKYDFMTFWLFGFCTVCLYCLLMPFITVWIGKEGLIDYATMTLLCVNFYITGQRVSTGNMKNASGLFENDWWSPLIQSSINLAVSIVGAYTLGLKGVYIGTLISGLVPTVIRPYIIHKYLFEKSAKMYYLEYAKRVLVTGFSVVILTLLSNNLVLDNMYVQIAVRLLACIVVTNLLYFIFWRKSEELNYFINLAKDLKNQLSKDVLK